MKVFLINQNKIKYHLQEYYVSNKNHGIKFWDTQSKKRILLKLLKLDYLNVYNL
jgi:hypothetical protein